jgi:hypothetical protein
VDEPRAALDPDRRVRRVEDRWVQPSVLACCRSVVVMPPAMARPRPRQDAHAGDRRHREIGVGAHASVIEELLKHDVLRTRRAIPACQLERHAGHTLNRPQAAGEQPRTELGRCCARMNNPEPLHVAGTKSAPSGLGSSRRSSCSHVTGCGSPVVGEVRDRRLEPAHAILVVQLASRGSRSMALRPCPFGRTSSVLTLVRRRPK